MNDEEVWVLASFDPVPETRGEAARILDGMVAPTRAEPGCRRYDLFEEEDGSLHLLECYDDRAALEHHRETDHYKAYRAAITDHLASPIAVKVLTPRRVA